MIGAQNKVQVRIVAVDLSRPDFVPAIRSLTNSIALGFLVNNAGFGLAGYFLEHELEEELNLLNVNCLGDEFSATLLADIL